MKLIQFMQLSVVTIVTLSSVACASLRYGPVDPSGSHLKIQAEDGTWVACDVYDRQRDRVVVISPGFLQHKRSDGIYELIRELLPDFDVISMDYRGIGESSGRYTYSAKEHADLHAVLRFAERRWQHVGVIGVSLGAAIAINELADHPHAQSLVTISAPMAFDAIEKTVSPKAKSWAFTQASFSMRSGSPFLSKRDPIEAIERLIIPVLLIHGGKDRVVYERHSRELYAKAPGIKQYLDFPEAGHAAELIQPHLAECVSAIRQWFDQTLR